MASEDIGNVSHDNLEPANEEDFITDRNASVEPLVSTGTGTTTTKVEEQPEMKSSSDRRKISDEMPIHVARQLRNVLNTRPSLRMASRQQLAPLHEPLHEDSFNRENPIRHTLPVRTSAGVEDVKSTNVVDSSIRRKQFHKTSFLSSYSLGERIPLQQMATPTPTSAIGAESTTQSISSLAKTELKASDIDSRRTSDPEVPNIVVQDIEHQKSLASNNTMGSVIEEVPVRTLERTSELQKSTRHLKQRMLQHRQTTLDFDNQHIIRAGCVADWQYVKWPKIKSWIQIQLSRRLWKSHLKEVEGHFGTAVVSYFIFLRWLFIMNLLIFMLWFSFICIPEIVYISSRVLNSTSQASCVFQTPSINNNSCSSTSTSSLVFSVQSSNNCSYTENPFDIRTCSFNDNGVADSESGSEVTVVGQLYTADCIEVDPDTATVPNITTYVLCPNVDPFYPWYTYLTDFISGTGIFNETMLFHGIYPNTSIGNFSFDIAFLAMIGIIYVVSMILLIYKMGHAFNESYVEFGKKRKVNFCNKLFTAWDFNITNAKTADLKKVHIKTDFQEELADINARETKRTNKELAIVILIRICTNTFVIVSLVGAGAAIYFSAQFELLVARGDISSIPIVGEYLSSIVISVLNAVYPLVFTFVAKIEKYQTAGEAVIITLLRTILVRLSSLLVLLASLYNVISGCTRVVSDTEDTSECTFATLTGNIITFNDSLVGDESCPVCWETFIGQQFFRLALTNLVVSLLATVTIESGRNFAAYCVKRTDFKYERINSLLGKVVKRGNFNISKSILDLIYTQSLLWLGFLFSPLLPTIILLTSFCLFYVKKYSLIYNLEPDKKGFARSARTSFMFLLLMLLALFASALPVLYAVTQLKPSENCGPFRGQDTMYQSMILLIERWSCTLQIIVDFFTSAAFVVPLLIFLLLVVYAMYVMLKARDDRFNLIKKQLVLEGANVTHIVGHLDTVLSQLVEETSNSRMGSDKLKRFPSQGQSPNMMDDLYKRYSKNLTAEANRSSAILDTRNL